MQTPPSAFADRPELTATLDDASPETETEFQDDPSIVDDLRSLIEEANALARAELAYQKSRAAYTASQGKKVLALCIVGGGLAFFALTAMVVGLVIALTPIITAWGAMALVTLALLLCSGLCLASARARMKATRAFVADHETEAGL